MGEVDAVKRDAPAGRPAETRQRFDELELAIAVDADDAEDLAAA